MDRVKRRYLNTSEECDGQSIGVLRDGSDPGHRIIIEVAGEGDEQADFGSRFANLSREEAIEVAVAILEAL